MAFSKRRFAQLSGAAVGYMADNLPGAFTGYVYGGKSYDYFHPQKKRKMAPFPTPPNSNIFKKVKHNRPLPAPNYPSVPLTKAASRHKGRPTNHKKGKKIKVSKYFKDKVAKALSDKVIHGSWDQISFDNLSIIGFPNNGQIVTGLGELSSNDHSDWAFDPEDFLHAASVLWNDKADSQSSRLWHSSSNLGYSETGLAGDALTDVRTSGDETRFQMNIKLTIKKSYEVYKIKNNTQRTMVMKIFLCAPKEVGAKSQILNAQPAGSNVITVTSDPAPIGNPGTLWQNELQKQVRSNINIAKATVNTLYNDPKDCPGFNKVYKTDCTTIVLEPGQVYDYYIQGPSNFTIDYNTLLRGSGTDDAAYMGIQKWMRYPFMTAYLDLVSDGSFTGHYAPTGTVQGKLALCIERHMKFHLEMPESTGSYIGLNSSTSSWNKVGILENNLRRDCYFRTIYGMVGPVVDVQAVNVQNPAMVIDITS